MTTSNQFGLSPNPNSASNNVNNNSKSSIENIVHRPSPMLPSISSLPDIFPEKVHLPSLSNSNVNIPSGIRASPYQQQVPKLHSNFHLHQHSNPHSNSNPISTTLHLNQNQNQNQHHQQHQHHVSNNSQQQSSFIPYPIYQAKHHFPSLPPNEQVHSFHDHRPTQRPSTTHYVPTYIPIAVPIPVPISSFHSNSPSMSRHFENQNVHPSIKNDIQALISGSMKNYSSHEPSHFETNSNSNFYQSPKKESLIEKEKEQTELRTAPLHQVRRRRIEKKDHFVNNKMEFWLEKPPYQTFEAFLPKHFHNLDMKSTAKSEAQRKKRAKSWNEKRSPVKKEDVIKVIKEENLELDSNSNSNSNSSPSPPLSPSFSTSSNSSLSPITTTPTPSSTSSTSTTSTNSTNSSSSLPSDIESKPTSKTTSSPKADKKQKQWSKPHLLPIQPKPPFYQKKIKFTFIQSHPILT